MDETHPVQALLARLEAARLLAIDELSSSSETPNFEEMQKLAVIQSALTAVSEEIEFHRVRLGGGSEQALK
jgi:hypothetical protein